eukprot:1316300-Amorphochlora_amoeboformis.AAC.1
MHQCVIALHGMFHALAAPLGMDHALAAPLGMDHALHYWEWLIPFTIGNGLCIGHWEWIKH